MGKVTYSCWWYKGEDFKQSANTLALQRELGREFSQHSLYNG